MAVDLIASFVNDDLMVKPAQHDQVDLIGLSAASPRLQVMDLEPASGFTSVGTTPESVLGQ
jgi:hypothetical protein